MRQMNTFEIYGKEIVSVFVPILVWFLNRYFKNKAKLYFGKPHSFTFIVDQPQLNEGGQPINVTQRVMTESVITWNSGKETATNVELLFNWKPQYMNVWPPRHYEGRTEVDNRYTVIFSSMAPGERIQCELLSVGANNNLPGLLTVRCDQCEAEEKQMISQIFVPNWARRLILVLLLAGLAAVTYILLFLIQIIVLKTQL